MKVLAIVPYPLDYCAGQRFRIEMWAKRLAERGIEVKFLPFADNNLTDVLYKPGKNLRKGSLLLGAFVKQLINVCQTEKPDLIFIYREAALLGPAIIEKLVRRWKIPIVYDIDEPLFVPLPSTVNGQLNKLRFFSKVDKLFKLSDCVFAVNETIAEHARKFNDNVEIVPMTIDVERYKPGGAAKNGASPKIAWVGTWSNQKNIELAVPAMRELRKAHEFTFRIIADTPMSFAGVDVDFVPWAYDVEVAKLQESDIGVVPVGESAWSRWKFFFKTVQFMGLGMPIVASATGSNLEIIKDGVNGFLVETEKDWYEKLKVLVENPDLRRKMGIEARKTAVEKFDIEKQYDFLEKKFKEMTLKTKGK